MCSRTGRRGEVYGKIFPHKYSLVGRGMSEGLWPGPTPPAPWLPACVSV